VDGKPEVAQAFTPEEMEAVEANFVRYGCLSSDPTTGETVVTIPIKGFVRLVNELLTFARDLNNRVYMRDDGLVEHYDTVEWWNIDDVREWLFGEYPEQMEDSEPADTYIDVGRMFGE
jgi:hypothetical protein